MTVAHSIIMVFFILACVMHLLNMERHGEPPKSDQLIALIMLEVNLVALLLLLLGGCGQPVLIAATPPTTPETPQLLEEPAEVPSFDKIHPKYFEPHWL